VVRLDTVVDIFGGFETGSLVGTADMRPHVCGSVLWGLSNVLAAHTKAKREARSNVMLGVMRQPIRIGSKKVV